MSTLSLVLGKHAASDDSESGIDEDKMREQEAKRIIKAVEANDPAALVKALGRLLALGPPDDDEEADPDSEDDED